MSADKSRVTDREWRLFEAEATIQQITPTNVEENTCNMWLKAGKFGRLFVVNDDGSIVISKEAYADDILAFVAACLSRRLEEKIKGKNSTEKAHTAVRAACMYLDMRAFDAHGFSASPESLDVDAEGAYAVIAEKFNNIKI